MIFRSSLKLDYLGSETMSPSKIKGIPYSHSRGHILIVMVMVLVLNVCLYLGQVFKLGHLPGRVAQSVGHLTRKSRVLGSIPGLATYFRFSFRFFKKGSCQLLAKVCARSTG